MKSDKTHPGASEVELIASKYQASQKFNAKRTKVAKVLKPILFCTFSSNVIIESAQNLETLTKVETYVNAFLNTGQTLDSLSGYLVSDLLNGISDSVMNSSLESVFVATTLTALGVVNYLSHYNTAKGNKISYFLNHDNSDFIKSLSKYLDPQARTAYEVLTKNLSKSARHKHIVGEHPTQKYSDLVTREDLVFVDSEKVFLGAEELANYVVNSKSDLAKLLKEKCLNQIEGLEPIEAYLSKADVVKRLNKSQSKMLNVPSFINEYLNSIHQIGYKLVKPATATDSESVFDQVTDIKHSILRTAKVYADMHASGLAFSEHVIKLQDELKKGPVSKEFIQKYKKDLVWFMGLEQYKGQDDKELNHFYSKISRSAQILHTEMESFLRYKGLDFELFNAEQALINGGDGVSIGEFENSADFFNKCVAPTDATGVLNVDNGGFNYLYEASSRGVRCSLQEYYNSFDYEGVSQDVIDELIDEDMASIELSLAKNSLTYSTPKLKRISALNLGVLDKISNNIRADQLSL